MNLQLWHQRDNLDPQLKNIFLRLPALQTFEFRGEIRMLATLCAMCCQVRARKCSKCFQHYIFIILQKKLCVLQRSRLIIDNEL